MAGAVTVTEKKHISPIKKITWAWTSTSGGAADLITNDLYDGKLIGLTTIPAGGGSAPSANYDVTVNDSDGHDVLAGAGMNRHTSNTEHVTGTSLAGVCQSKLTLNVTNAGDTKQGTVILYIQ